jgi:hypothetical protein
VQGGPAIDVLKDFVQGVDKLNFLETVSRTWGRLPAGLCSGRLEAGPTVIERLHDRAPK